ncbi:hypothetical protein XYCOK13_09530 [Xylanibacillus composti]|uniref:Transcriptional regulator Rv0078-like C-terminal domain-containing protein n=1 Tax=Xylanibacillus composti TaxID=1572762 RepID=A0A8J4GZN4_9BACL|nr:hypothetical protein [Xylanibacillus composti]GIQ68129.1 hypothetical protein XYCOK13_09530 [Xylanibacillus composti]
MDERHSMRLLRSQLELMQQVGALKAGSVEAMTQFLSGGLKEMTLWHAQESAQEGRKISLEETMAVISLFLEGIRRRASAESHS